MTDKNPEFPRPSVGDELIIVIPKTRYRETMVIPVRVAAMARYKITVEYLDGSCLQMYNEFDLRNQYSWDTTPVSKRTGIRSGSPRLHTEETWAWEQRMQAADKYLRKSCIHSWDIGGTLKSAINADRIGFVNALRRFEGLEEI